MDASRWHRFARLALAVILLAVAAGARASTTGSVGATVDVSPLAVELRLASGEVAAGKPVRVRAIVRNLGDAPVGPVTVTLRFEPAGISVTPEAAQVVARLAPGRSATVSWQVRGVTPGAYVLLARATWSGFATDSRALLLVVRPRG